MDPAIVPDARPDVRPAAPSRPPVPTGPLALSDVGGRRAVRRPWERLSGLAALAGVTAYVGMVDPSDGGAYPLCPSRLVLGIDCPACGGLRGTHDLLHGDLAGALGHNLLLPLWLGLYAVMLGVWLLPLTGRPARAVRPPRWLIASGLAVALAFTVVRNLPIAGLEFLASD